METQRVEVEPVRDNQSTFFSDVRCNSIHLSHASGIPKSLQDFPGLVLTSTKHHQPHPFSFYTSLHWKFKLLTSKYLNFHFHAKKFRRKNLLWHILHLKLEKKHLAANDKIQMSHVFNPLSPNIKINFNNYMHALKHGRGGEKF